MSKKANLKRVLLCLLAIILALIFVSWSSENIKNEKYYLDTIQTSIEKTEFLAYNDSIKIAEFMLEQKKDSLKNVLIYEVERYVFKNAPKVNEKVPSYLVHKSLEEDIDLCFVMAQTEQETNYGTLGIGREVSKCSLFGVMKGNYQNYNDAIDDYFKLLKEKYLGKGKTEKHLLNNYVNHSGRRYAEDPNYEIVLKKRYYKISNNTEIKRLQKEISILS